MVFWVSNLKLSDGFILRNFILSIQIYIYIFRHSYMCPEIGLNGTGIFTMYDEMHVNEVNLTLCNRLV